MKRLLIPLLATLAFPNIAVAHPLPQTEEQQESLEQSEESNREESLEQRGSPIVPKNNDDVPLIGYPIDRL